MFEKEAEEYAKDSFRAFVKGIREIAKIAFQKGAEFGYNKGYHDAEEHYLNVIDNQHKLVDESKKKDFRKCMKCTDGTYQSGFKDGLRKANEWHYVKYGLPEELHDVLCFVIHNEHRYVLQGYLRDGRWVLSPLGTYLNNDDVIAWKEIVLPKESE